MSTLEMITQLILVIALTVATLVGVRVLVTVFRDGTAGLRRTMDEGAGFKAFVKGRLVNGQGSTHLNEGHGLHFEYDENGAIVYDQKSKVV